MMNRHHMGSGASHEVLLPGLAGGKVVDIRDYMPLARPGDTVSVHHRSRVRDGIVLDDSARRQPLQFTIGEGRLIPGFEQAVIGMRPGEWKTVIIPAEEAYGPYREELVVQVPRRSLLSVNQPRIGHQTMIHLGDDRGVMARIIDVSDDRVTLDANSPLAGKDLVFDIHLVEIVPGRRPLRLDAGDPLLGPVA